MRKVKFNLLYEKQTGNDPIEREEYQNISIVGCYHSNDHKNLGYKAWVPDRNDYRNFNYNGVIYMEVAL